MAARIGDCIFRRFLRPTHVTIEPVNQVGSPGMRKNSKCRHSEARCVPRNPSLSLFPTPEKFLTSFGMTDRSVFSDPASLAAGLLAFILAGTLLLLPGKTARADITIPASQDEKPSASSIRNGKKLYISYGCFECHGRQAEGTSVGGPRLGPNPISFPAFSKYIRQPTGQMPPFTAKVTSEADLADIYAFLQSLPHPPKADSIPALK
jgi:mono/diheme cytochrome c family protein